MSMAIRGLGIVSAIAAMAVSLPAAAQLAAAVLPASRSVAVGNTATAFATIINAGTTTATSCSIAPATSFSGTFLYQTTNPATNQLTGTPNTPANIAAGKFQTYVVAFTPNAAVGPIDEQLTFTCANAGPAPVSSGINTLLFSANAKPVPDIVALGATASGDGTLHLASDSSAGAFAVATVNVGASGAITASVDTGLAILPVTLSICATNTSGACIATPSSTVATTINSNATPTFAIFATANGAIPFNPGLNRIYVRFADSTGASRGATSVAVTTGETATGIQVQSVSSSSPMPLSPLKLTVTGVDPTQAISVAYANSTGSGALVVVPTPLYFDPKSGAIGAGTVTLTLGQGGQSSPPIVLNIQGLPSVASYGTSLGQISHSFLINDATMTGQTIGQLQAASARFPAIDTSQAQLTLNNSLQGALTARNDVDLVMTNNGTVLAGGTLPNGATVQFDKNSQDLMDRVIGLYLSGVAPIVPGAPAALSATDGPPPPAGGLSSFLTFLQTLNGSAETANAVQDLQHADSVTDSALAIAKGINSYVGALASNGVFSKQTGTNSQLVGAVFAMYDVLDDTGKMLGDAAFLYTAADGTDPAVLSEAAAEIENLRTKTFLDTASLGLSAVELYTGEIEGLAGVAFQGIKFAVATAQGLTAANGQTPAAEETYQAETQIAGQVTAGFPNTGFYQLDGQANITNSAGIFASQTSLDLCCFGSAELGIAGIADPSGNYEVFAPAGVPGTNYSQLTMSALDLVSDTVLGSTAVNLGSATTAKAVSLNTITGSCVDTDASNPDGDDPDCD
jgi:hypothetical protein